MALYSSSYLKNLAAENSSVLESRMFAEKNKTHTSFDIFLSHSYLDRDEVNGLYLELTNQGYSVYVDWIVDPYLDRNNVTKATAEKIRERMKMSKSLLLAVSANAAMSKWMPWEQGYVDGHVSRCAIIPVSRDAQPPKKLDRLEYLLLYPYIKRARVGYKEEVFITESGNYYVGFGNWLNRNESPVYNSTNIDLL